MSEMEVGVDVPQRRRPSLCCPDSKSSPSCSPSPSSLSLSPSSSWNITPYLDDVEDQGNGNEKEKGNGNVV